MRAEARSRMCTPAEQEWALPFRPEGSIRSKGSGAPCTEDGQISALRNDSRKFSKTRERQDEAWWFELREEPSEKMATLSSVFAEVC